MSKIRLCGILGSGKERVMLFTLVFDGYVLAFDTKTKMSWLVKEEYKFILSTDYGEIVTRDQFIKKIKKENLGVLPVYIDKTIDSKTTMMMLSKYIESFLETKNAISGILEKIFELEYVIGAGVMFASELMSVEKFTTEDIADIVNDATRAYVTLGGKQEDLLPIIDEMNAVAKFIK